MDTQYQQLQLSIGEQIRARVDILELLQKDASPEARKLEKVVLEQIEDLLARETGKVLISEI
jgi:hypothetical protein